MNIFLERKQIAERLAQREPTTLAAFIMMLVDDEGPLGDYVRTFIAAEHADAAASIVTRSIDALRYHEHKLSYRRRRDLALTDHADPVLDAIEPDLHHTNIGCVP